MTTSIRPVLDAYYRAMQTGQTAEADLLALFADDAVYVEPFAGAPRTHTGKDAIQACLRASWTNSPPDMTLTVNRVDLDGNKARVEWTCASPIFPAPMRGEDQYVVVDRLIQRLETRFIAG
jgi:uncharacterized protein (TIGR02246 family)